jgi:hypothetical protein
VAGHVQEGFNNSFVVGGNADACGAPSVCGYLLDSMFERCEFAVKRGRSRAPVREENPSSNTWPIRPPSGVLHKASISVDHGDTFSQEDIQPMSEVFLPRFELLIHLLRVSHAM